MDWGSTDEQSAPPASASDPPARTIESRSEESPALEGQLQFSLGEILIVMFGVSLGLAVGRWLPGPLLPLILGVAVLVGWSKLYVDDWEPRWAMVVWVSSLGAYVGTAFATFVFSLS